MSILTEYIRLKKQHPGWMLLFHCGDFYECYEEDALEAAKILGISYVRRVGDDSFYHVKMAGFPHYALDTYLPKLIGAGKKVIIVDK